MWLLNIMKKLQSMIGVLLLFILIIWPARAELDLLINDVANLTYYKEILHTFPQQDLDFLIDSEYCLENSQCNSSSHYERCSCDNLCGVLNDCCPYGDNMTSLNVTPLNVSAEQFSCEYIPGIEGIMLITKCAADWTDNETKSLCENEPSLDDTRSKVVVSHNTLHELVFKNMHCALCNNVHEYQFWKAIFQCYDFEAKNVSDCELSFGTPDEYTSYRDCTLHSDDIISNCPVDYNDTSIKQNCEQGETFLAYSGSMKFKNEYCATCNGDREGLRCTPTRTAHLESDMSDNFFSFRMLVDFNTEETLVERQFFIPGDENLDGLHPFKECEEDETYDPVSEVCRNMICPYNATPIKGKCVPNTLQGPSEFNVGNNTNVTETCPLSKLDSTEFEFRNGTNQVIFRNKIYNDTEYIKNGSNIFLCINTSYSLPDRRFLQASDSIERYISFVGLIISVIALLITIIVYFTFTELLNVPGKTLVALCISLLISQLLFLLSPLASGTNVACKIVAVLMHYFFLAAFSWMNVIAFDLLMAFSNMMEVGNRIGSSSKKFYLYSVYSLSIPLVIVGSALVLDFAVANETVDEVQPHYGESACWISSNNGLLAFFVGPLALFKLFDVIAFAFIVYYITKAKQQGAKATNKSNSSTFFIHLKLSLVMGLTWLFAFLANFTGNTIMWYLFIIFNTLQGLLISISFVCTRRVLRLIQSRYAKTTSKSPSNTLSTRATSVA